jgi:hypothetical protein
METTRRTNKCEYIQNDLNRLFFKYLIYVQKDLSEFMIKFLKKRYNTDMAAFEYSYAINDVFEKTNDNEYIQQFAGILNGKVCYFVYLNECFFIIILKNHLI